MALNVVDVVVRVKDDAAKTALTSLAGAFKGFGAVAAGALGVGLSGPLAAAGLAMGAFGAIAIPTISRIEKSVKQLQAAELAYNSATTAAGKKAAKEKLDAVKASLSQQDLALAGNIQHAKDMFRALGEALVPAINQVLKQGIALFRDLTPAIGSLAKAGAAVIEGFLKPFDTLVQSPFFARFVKTADQLARQVGPILGQTLTQIVKALMQIVVQAGPSAVYLLKQLLGAFTAVISGLVPFIAWVTKTVAAIDKWISKYPALKAAIIGIGIAVGIAVAAASDGILPLIGVIAVAIGAVIAFFRKFLDKAKEFLAQHKDLRDKVEALWTDIKNFFSDAWHFIDNNVIKPLVAAFGDMWQQLRTFWKQYGGEIKQLWGELWTTIKAVLRVAMPVIKAVVKDGLGTIITVFRTAFGLIIGALKVALDILTGHWSRAVRDWGDLIRNFGKNLLSLGKKAFSELWSGFKSVAGDIVNWLKSFGGGIIDVLKHILGIGSPSRVMYEIGKNTMQGLFNGLKAHTAPVIGHIGGTAGQIQALMQKMAAARGWTGAQWTALNNVEMREAGYSLTATNPTSGAYGLAQFIGGPSEYYAYGGNPNTAAGQIIGMLNYITQRYGNPVNAWAHEMAYGWYASGGITGSRWSVLGERGREMVRLPAGSYVASNPDTERMIASGGGAAAPAVIRIEAGNSELDRLLLRVLQRIIRTDYQGNVVLAFGGA